MEMVQILRIYQLPKNNQQLIKIINVEQIIREAIKIDNLHAVKYLTETSPLPKDAIDVAIWNNNNKCIRYFMELNIPQTMKSIFSEPPVSRYYYYPDSD